MLIHLTGGRVDASLVNLLKKALIEAEIKRLERIKS